MSSPGALPVDSDPVKNELMFLFNVWDGTTGVLMATSTVAVLLRVFVRSRIVKTFGYDDAAMVAAQVCFILCGVLSYVASSAFRVMVGTGEMVMTYQALLQTIRFSNAFYSLTMLLVKISVSIFFIKLFASSHRWQRHIIIFLTAASTALGVAYLVFTFASCGIMIQSQKTTIYHTGSDWCPIQQVFVNFSIAWSVFNAFTDIVFAVLAITIVWRAQMARSTKVSAAILILFGSIGSLASCARVATQLPITDVRLSGVLLTIWSNVEAGICVTAASLITLRPLFQSAVEKARSSFGSLRSNSNGSRDVYGSGGSKGTYRSHKSKSGSTSSSQKDVIEITDLESAPTFTKAGGVTVTRSWDVEEKDGDSCRSDSFSRRIGQRVE